jgi:uncharacterized protein (TIGR01777 family)
MRIVIAGGTGFLGRALTGHLLERQHHVTVLTRGTPPAGTTRQLSHLNWSPDGQSGPWARALDGAEAVVNLAGESIAARRWSAAQKKRILESRLMATRSLTAAIRAGSHPPALISGSAVGYYGNRHDEPISEGSQPGDDFLAEVCKAWESAATEVAQITRVSLVRTGIVLDRHEGALAKMLPPFYLFAGGPVGSGRQYWPWIHKTDWVRLVAWAIENESARGPINATAPKPVTNAEFSRALGRALHRPSLLPTPGLALRLMLGEMADALLLSGQRALPARATDLGFVFSFSQVDEALADIFKRN